jgi:3-methyladenine DNA glycosylase AlkD
VPPALEREIVSNAKEWVAGVEEALHSLADPERAVPMRLYMKNIAPFLGVSKPERDKAQKQFGLPEPGDETRACRLLYAKEHREFHYIATFVLRKRAKHLPSDALVDLRWFVQNHSWWDTIDELTKSIGGVVTQYPELVPELDTWVRDPDFWVNRAAILHQLGFGVHTDVDRLFRLCRVQAAHPEFFVSKAIGWALRDYAWTNPEAIRTFVNDHRSEFSPLTIREALKNIDDPKAGNRPGDRTPATPAKTL